MLNKVKINSDEFATRLGSYSHGYKVDLGNSYMIFTTGQIALDKDGNVMHPEDISEQTEFVFKSLGKILEKADASFDDVVKATIFVTDMNLFPEISRVRNKYFKNSEPVSTLVEVSKLVKEGCKVEIELVAFKQK